MVSLPVLVLLGDQMPALQEVLGYFLNWKSLIKNRGFLTHEGGFCLCSRDFQSPGVL